MAGSENDFTYILLPPSRVAVFSQDSETLGAAREIAEDWRFARVGMEVLEGSLETAVDAYRDTASPDLVIIQIESITNGLTKQLESLAAHCAEGTAAIIIGPVNDVNLYRRLIEMGVSDYLVKPVNAKILADIIAKTLIEKLGVTGSRLIGFIGAKGGTGTSTLAQAMAGGLAEILGQKTVLLDAAGGWSTMGVGMGFEPSTTLAEAARAAARDDQDGLKRMLFKANEKLSVLASGGDVMLEPALLPDQMEELIDTLMITWPVVVVDLSNSSADLQRTVLARANQIVLVSTPSLPALRLARGLLQEIRTARGGKEGGIDVLINKKGMDPANEVPPKDIAAALDITPAGFIPYLPKVFLKAESEGKTAMETREGQDIVRAHLIPLVKDYFPARGESAKAKTENPLNKMLGKLGTLKKG